MAILIMPVSGGLLQQSSREKMLLKVTEHLLQGSRN